MLLEIIWKRSVTVHDYPAACNYWIHVWKNKLEPGRNRNRLLACHRSFYFTPESGKKTALFQIFWLEMRLLWGWPVAGAVWRSWMLLQLHISSQPWIIWSQRWRIHVLSLLSSHLRPWNHPSPFAKVRGEISFCPLSKLRHCCSSLTGNNSWSWSCISCLFWCSHSFLQSSPNVCGENHAMKATFAIKG